MSTVAAARFGLDLEAKHVNLRFLEMEFLIME